MSDPPSPPTEHTKPPTPEPVAKTDLSDLLSQLGDEPDVDAPTIGSELTDPRDLERPEIAQAAVITSTGGIDFSPEFASIGSRFAGLAIDTGVTFLMMLPGAGVLALADGTVKLLGALLAVIGFGVATWLSARSVAANGLWIGNRITSTKVVNVSDGTNLTMPNAVVRFVTRALISPVLLFGFLMAFNNSQRRTFHDQLSGSIVTRPHRATWSIDDENE